jgi:hypothetical protein
MGKTPHRKRSNLLRSVSKFLKAVIVHKLITFIHLNVLLWGIFGLQREKVRKGEENYITRNFKGLIYAFAK